MNFHAKVAFASLALLLASLVPATAYASRNGGTAHTRSQNYHDRTPHVHSHHAHSHHS